MAGNWRYVRGNQSVGPLGLEEMRELVDRGELQPEDRVWTDGMPDWEPAGRRTELFPSDADAAPAQARSVVSAVSYFAPFGGQLPDRAAANLRGHAAPTGDASEWPLDDRLVGVFHDAMNPRRKISTAAALYFVLSVFWVIAASVVLIAIAARHTPGS